MNNDNYRNHNDKNKGSFLKNFVLSPFKVIWWHYNITQMFGFYGMFPKIIFSTRRQTFIQQKSFEKRIRGNFPRRNFPQESSPRGDLARGSYPWGNLTRGHFPRGILQTLLNWLKSISSLICFGRKFQIWGPKRLRLLLPYLVLLFWLSFILKGLCVRFVVLQKKFFYVSGFRWFKVLNTSSAMFLRHLTSIEVLLNLFRSWL